MNLGVRLLIIAYAGGLVMLGLQPLRKDHGGVIAYVEKHTQELLGKKVDLSKFALPQEVVVGNPHGKPLVSADGEQSFLGDFFKKKKEVKAFDRADQKTFGGVDEDDQTTLRSVLDKLAP